MRTPTALFLLLVPVMTFAQDRKKVLYQGGFDFREGLYTSFDQFRDNAPLYPLEDLVDDQGLRITDLHKSGKNIFYKGNNPDAKSIDDKGIWGYCNRNVIYIRTQSGFAKIGMMGSLCHLVTHQTYSSWDYYTVGQASYTVQIQQVLDMRTGKLMSFGIPTMELVLQRELDLLDQFNALKKKRKKEQALFLFLRKYNERHPLYFPQ